MAEHNTLEHSLYLNVLDKYSRECLGYIGDITLNTETMLLITQTPFPLHQTREIVIELPNTDQFSKPYLTFQIEATWSRINEHNADEYQLGCQLLNASYSDLEILAYGIREMGIILAKKHSVRKNLLFYLEIYNQHSGELLGHLGDISDTGLMIIGETPLTLNKILDLNIRLPDLEEFTESGLEVRVETRWTRPDNNPDFHCTGCLLIDIAPEDEPIIDQIQDVLGLDD